MAYKRITYCVCMCVSVFDMYYRHICFTYLLLHVSFKKSSVDECSCCHQHTLHVDSEVIEQAAITSWHQWVSIYGCPLRKSEPGLHAEPKWDVVVSLSSIAEAYFCLSLNLLCAGFFPQSLLPSPQRMSWDAERKPDLTTKVHMTAQQTVPFSNNYH